MLSFSVTFFITIINVTFLYVVLRRILFKPVAKFVQTRTEGIQKDLDAARRATARAEALEAEFAEKMKTVQEESLRILQASREKAESERDAIIAKAKADAAHIVRSSLADLEQERRQAELVLRRETADLSILAASRILGENLDSDTNRALVEKFLSSVGVA